MAGTNNQTSSSSSSSSSYRWDVFLSFRGEDIRKTFIDHLYTALDKAGIQTFKDDPELQKGEEISSALLNAIQDSKMSIVVFSKNYAFSRWCLDELVEILECKRTKGQTVLPIFYHVDPSEVRHQLGSFAEAMEKYKLRFMDKVKICRDALTEASNLSGYHLKNDANGYESNLIQKIVKNVLREVNPKALIVAEHLVGMDTRVGELYEKISLGSTNVRVIGIYGMGGIGKTTIAKAFYNKYYHHFECSCFLENVRETSQAHNGPLSLVEQLISELLEKQDFKVATVERGISFLKERVRTKKVLIVLDDLDESSQLKLLVRDWNFFRPESRIIITTRDTRMLVEFEKIDEGYMVMPYMVETLDKDKSFELLSFHAFRRTILEDFREILERIVSYTGGIPLALKVLGSFLFRRTKEEWISTLEKLQQIPNSQIQTILKISYDALDHKEKEIFLDIAFFLVGMDKEEANHIFDSSGFYPHIGIKVLEERCLLTIDLKNKFRMHDLIRDMGREIVREESIKEPGERSRLWCQEEVCDVLKKYKGTKKIEGIRLDITSSGQEYFNTKTFESMPNLRLLQINNVHLTGSFENSFEELRWLCWRYCPLTCLPPSFHPPKLVSLDIQHSNVKTLWEGPTHLKSLKFLNASRSQFLTTTPNLGEVKMLEKLVLGSCSSLVQVHPSVGVLRKLVHLDLSECYHLQQLPDSIGHMALLVKLDLFKCRSLRNLPSSICNLSSLEQLNLNHCYNLVALPVELGNMKSLKSLIANNTAIEQLPDSVGHLSRLVYLRLNSKNIRNLPNSICNLCSLESLVLNNCSKLVGLPVELGNMKSLKSLIANNTAIEQLPDSVGHLSRLYFLILDKCRNLRNLPNSICNLRSLEHLGIRGCLNLENLPEQLGNMELLSHLRITIDRLPDSVGLLKNLATLVVEGRNIRFLPASLSQLANLRILCLINCTSLRSLPKLPLNLQHFDVKGCPSIEQLPDLPPDLRYLDASDCTSLKKLSNVAALKYLSKLDLTNCTNLRFTIEESFLQGRFNSYQIKIPAGSIPDWFSHQSTGCSVSFDMPPNLANNFLGMVLWVVYSIKIGYTSFHVDISNKTDGTEKHYKSYCKGYPKACEKHSWVAYIGKPISMKSQDRIEIVFGGDEELRCGVHLLHNNAATQISCKRGRDFDIAETSSFKRQL